MSLAADIGHSFADLVWHPRQLVHHRHDRPAPPEPAPTKRTVDIDAAVAGRRRAAEQWNASYVFAVGLNR